MTPEDKYALRHARHMLVFLEKVLPVATGHRAVALNDLNRTMVEVDEILGDIFKHQATIKRLTGKKKK